MGTILETIMLICFGCSWPISVIKLYKARTAKGISFSFNFLIWIGYIAGIASKFVNGQTNYVLIAYFLNFAIVSIKILIYFRNVALDKQQEKDTIKEIS